MIPVGGEQTHTHIPFNLAQTNEMITKRKYFFWLKCLQSSPVLVERNVAPPRVHRIPIWAVIRCEFEPIQRGWKQCPGGFIEEEGREPIRHQSIRAERVGQVVERHWRVGWIRGAGKRRSDMVGSAEGEGGTARGPHSGTGIEVRTYTCVVVSNSKYRGGCTLDSSE